MLLRAILIAGVIALAVGQDLQADSNLKFLGAPCRAKNFLSALRVTDRTDGRDRIVFANSNEWSNLELFYLDVDNNTCEVFAAPAGQGSWCILEVPGDRLVITTYFHGQFLVFDLRTKKFVAVAGVPGEEYVWNGVLAADGRVYGGTYPGAKLVALDLNTYEVEVLGAPAAPNLYLDSISATADGRRLLCPFGREKPVTLVFDIESKKFSPAPADLSAFRPPQGKPQFMPDVDLKGGHVAVWLKDGSAVGIRGQKYFRMKPGEKELNLIPIPGEAGPKPLQFLKADSVGRLWGGPEYGQTLCSLDTRTGEIRNTDVVCDHHGAIFGAAGYKGKVFSASYSGGDIACYDPDSPWDQWSNKNPKTIAQLGPRGYIRPIAGMFAGPNGKLYSGWWAKYGVYGGALAITDPDTGDTELVENPLGQQGLRGIAVGENAVYIGSGLQANGLPDKTGEGPRFGVFDLTSKEVVYTREFDGASKVTNLVFDAKTRRVFMSVDGDVYVFDCAANRFLSDKPIKAPGVYCRFSTGDGEGTVYYSDKKRVIRFNLATLKSRCIATADDEIKLLEIAPDGKLYIESGASLYAVLDRK